MQDQNVVSFEKNDTSSLLKSLGYKIQGDDTLIYHRKKVYCDVCESEIKSSHLGGIFPGSRKVYCDCIDCLSQYVANVE